MLEAGGKAWGEAPEGLFQGMPDSTAGFSVGMQSSVVALDDDCKAGGGAAIAGADDVHCLGPAAVLLPAVAKFQAELREQCGLHLQLSKSCLFTWEGALPEGTPPDLPLAGEVVNGEFLRGFLCFGCPVGEDRYVTHKLQEIVTTIVEDARKSVEVLKADRQALWAALRSSISQRFDYWSQLVRPSLSRPVAASLDGQLWKVLEATLGFKVPRGEQQQGEGGCIINVPIAGLDSQNFQEWVLRQPIQLHGAGFRSHEESCYPAFVGALEQAAPYLAKLPGLDEIFGGEGAWGENADTMTRWAPLLASGQRDGAELWSAWEAMQQEAQQSAAFVGDPLEGALAVDVAGAGGDHFLPVRQRLTAEREKMRGKVLLRALELHPQREARPVWSWEKATS